MNMKQRTYLPQNFEIKWETLEPLFNELKNRAIDSVDEMESWLKDVSELEAAVEKTFHATS